MKAIIVYFSQTGNTRKIAQAIHAGMKQVVANTDIARLKEIDARDLSRYDLIGLGSPIWRFKAPANVQAFINRLPALDGKLAFPFCTHGSYAAGFMPRVTAALVRKGLTVIGYNDWYGSCFLPYLPKPYLTDGHPDDIDLKEAQDFGRKMAVLGSRISSGETNLIPKLPRGKAWEEIYGKPLTTQASAFHEFRQAAQKAMKVNMAKCRYPTCTLCVDNCPMNSIDFSVTPPVFKKTCATDWFCEQICPWGAIEVDYTDMTAEHDRIVGDLYTNFTREAEATGRFRRLVPLEKVGWHTHQHEKPELPRLIPS